MAKIIAIKENYLFSKLYAKGKKASGKYIVVYALRNYKSSDTLLGITTGKKIGKAVQRSRVRRLIRESFRLLCVDKRWRKPWWIVVVARSSATEKGVGMNEVRCEMENLFHKLDLFVQPEIEN